MVSRAKRSSGRSSGTNTKNIATTNTNTNTNNTTMSTTTPGVLDSALSSLQPLRDLSRNWDVDIASCLEEYLQELAGIHPQQMKNLAAAAAKNTNDVGNNTAAENNNEVPNFAHAALLLQNSSNVYSRKVEYLYTLVYKALEEFFQASKFASSSTMGNKKRKSKGTDLDVEQFYEADPHECFLLLDDIVPEDTKGTKINLKDEDDEDDDDNGNIVDKMGETCRTVQTNRLSLGGLEVSRMERTWGSATMNRSASAGSSRRRSISSTSASVQQQKALLGILNNGKLRLMAGECGVGDNGILLMPGSQQSTTNSSSSSSNGNGRNSFGSTGIDLHTNASMLSNDPLACTIDFNGMHNSNNNHGNNQIPAEVGYSNADTDGGPKILFGNDMNDDDDDGPGFVLNDDDDDDHNCGGDAMDIDDPNPKNEGIAENRPMMGLLSSSSTTAKRVAFADSDDLQSQKQPPKKKQEKIDPWALLDPHSSGGPSYKPKPLKKGKTYRLPEGIVQPPSECVTGASTRQISTQPPELRRMFYRPKQALKFSYAVETYRIAMGKQLKYSKGRKISYRGLSYGDEFLYIAKENAKLRAAKRREKRKQEKQAAHSSARDASTNIDGGNTHYDDDDDNDDDGFVDFGGGGGDDDYDDDYDNNDNGANTGNAGLTSLDDAIQRNAHYEDGTDEGNGNGHKKTFEELCRAHIQAFAKSAEKFAVATKLSQRISQWQRYLAPILEDEERRSSFDIHRYSEMFLEAAVEASKANTADDDDDDEENGMQCNLDFEEVTKGNTRSDVCRMFLASLMLANAGNIEIEEGAYQGYKFEVVSDKFENLMERYQAPSTIIEP